MSEAAAAAQQTKAEVVSALTSVAKQGLAHPGRRPSNVGEVH